MSSGRPTRRTGVRLMWSSTASPSTCRLSALRSIGVSTNPGGTALTVIPAGPYSSARDREAVDRRLRRDVMRNERLTGVRARRRDVDDAAPAGFDHVRQHGLDGVEHAIQVDVDDCGPLREAHLRELLEAFDAGSVDQHQDRPNCSRIAATALSTCARSVTSAIWPNPSSLGDRSMTATWSPSLRSRAATARPIPDAPPVTTAVFKPATALSLGNFPERLPNHHMPITPRRLWSSPWTDPRFALPCRRPTPPVRVTGATPSAKSKISGTQRFSSQTTTSAPVPHRRPRAHRGRICPHRGDGGCGGGQPDTLHIGCRVFCIDYHVPAVLAKEAATLDLLSDGRLEMGMEPAGAKPNTTQWDSASTGLAAE